MRGEGASEGRERDAGRGEHGEREGAEVGREGEK